MGMKLTHGAVHFVQNSIGIKEMSNWIFFRENNFSVIQTTSRRWSSLEGSGLEDRNQGLSGKLLLWEQAKIKETREGAEGSQPLPTR